MTRLDAALALALARRGSAPVLISGSTALDGAGLEAAIARTADTLSRLGARRVCSALDNSVGWVVLDLAVRRLDIVHIPVPLFFSAGQAAHVAADCDADLWIGAAPAGDGWTPRSPIALASVTAPVWQRAPCGKTLPASTRCVTYTSGTTAQPKGVCLGSDALLQVAESIESATRGLVRERHLCLLPLATLLENIAGIYSPLLAGGEIAVPSLAEIGYSGASGLDTQRLMACIARYRPDSVILVPQLLDAIVTAIEEGSATPTTLRFIAVGGARVGSTLLARAQRVGLPVHEGYGLSECASVVTLNRPGRMRAGSAGIVLDHVQLRVDSEGELHVRGSTMQGYVGMPSSIAVEVATGDIGRVDEDGYVWIEGRRRNVFITAFGRNVSPEWVESELVAHPLIAQAVVDGEARPWNVAILVARTPGTGERALQRAVEEVNAGLPDYARASRFIIADAPFAVANGLATANGRARRSAVLQRYADRIDALHLPLH